MAHTISRTLGQIAVAATLLAAMAPAQAVEGFLQVGVDLGGDEMLQVYYDDGRGDEINAGELLQISGGIIFPTFDNTNEWETQLSFGWKTDSVSADNGSATFDRFPLEALQFIRVGDVRLGGGITVHLNPEMNGDGVLSDLQVEFADAWGGVVELDYFPRDIVMIGVRATMIDYEAQGDVVDGSSIGVIVGLRVP